MKTIIKIIVSLNVLLNIKITYAIPGPIIATGVGFLSFLVTVFSIGFGIFIYFSKKILKSIINFYKKHFYIGISITLVIIIGIGFFIYSYLQKDAIEGDKFAELKNYLESNNFEYIDPLFYDEVIKNIEIKNDGSYVNNNSLEREIRYSMEANRNIYWYRYLVEGKIQLDDNLISEIKNGDYSVNIEEFINNSYNNPDKFKIIDLRTKEEFETSAIFKNSINIEYNKIINDEVDFDKNITYYFLCHDGMTDISRSLFSSIYLREKGINAYSLENGIGPIIASLGIAPIGYNKKFEFERYKDQSGAIIIDTLGAMEKLNSWNKINENNKIFKHIFYTNTEEENLVNLGEINNYIKENNNVYFACYDNFSCFYAKIYSEKFDEVGETKILIIR